MVTGYFPGLPGSRKGLKARNDSEIEMLFTRILSYVVDVFYLLGGFMAAYLLLHAYKKIKLTPKTYFMMQLNRFLRLTPAFYFCLLFTSLILAYT